MGFHPQPNDYTCGPFALKHGLVALGQMVDEQLLKKAAGSHWWSGTNEIRLARAAQAADCELVLIRSRSPEKARKTLLANLRAHRPLVLCVDDWGHWITVLAASGSKFVIVDSNLDPVLDVLSWSQLKTRWQYLDYDYHEEDPPTLYEGYALEPQFRVTMQGNFSIERVQFLRRADNQSLARYWDAYLEDLLAICKPRSSRQSNVITVGEFMRRHQELIVNRVAYWHGEVERKEIVRLLNNFRFVAETYGLVIPGDTAHRAVADLSILTAMWVASRRGIGDMYGSNQ